MFRSPDCFLRSLYIPAHPYGVLWLLPGVYQVVVPESLAGTCEFKALLHGYAVLAERRCCLVMHPKRCIYFDPNGRRRASAAPPEGIFLKLSFADWRREVDGCA